MPQLPLARVKIIDLTRVRAGPTCVRHLADLGAQVIKVENPHEHEGFGRHHYDFQNLHRNKRSMVLNLKHERGKEILKRLVQGADVLVENYRPDVKYRLGIDYESLRPLNPRLIYASISGFGQSGPYAQRPGVDQIAQGMGGLMSITGEPGRGPMRVGIPIADLSAGMFLAIGILAALYEREASGEGQWVHTSLLEAMVQMLDFQATRWLIAREVPKQVGNNHPTTVPTNAYPTRDGYINIAVAGQETYARLCKALGREDLITDPRFDTPQHRQQHRDELNAIITECLQQRPAAEWVELLNAAGVPCGPIYTIDQTFADPQVRHLRIAQPLDHPKLGRIEVLGVPVTLSRTPGSVRTPTPEKGEHTVEVLQELGYSEAEIEELRRQGVVA
ncbi:MAG: CoA transferase [Candidatus Tectimicrobiota bacterium]|nr:MAG: CoA transferase [Candidatus Tectomicrobia bacterium]